MRGVWGWVVLLGLLGIVGSLQAHDDLNSDKRQHWSAQTFVSPGISFNNVMYQYDICASELYAANQETLEANPMTKHLAQQPGQPHFTGHLSAWNFQKDIEIYIPEHESCFDVLVFRDFNNLPQNFEIDFNVCAEDYAQYISLDYTGPTVLKVYLSREFLPCYNEKGQRLKFYDENWRRLEKPYYSTERWIGVQFEDIDDLPYCWAELNAHNRQYFAFRGVTQSIPGSRALFIEGLRRCKHVHADPDTSLYDASRQFNVCMEILRPRGPDNYDIPFNTPPCYDDAGKRIGHHDRLVYEAKLEESIMDVARAHGVCVQDLINANSHMGAWPYTTATNRHVFIPETAPCDFGDMTHITEAGDTLRLLSIFYNVCMNQIYDANIALSTKYGDYDDLPIGAVVHIPDQPPCYTYYLDRCNRRDKRESPQVCYASPVDFEKDYTGTIPPVLPVPYSTETTCYQLKSGMTIIYDNQPLTLFERYGIALQAISDCYSVEIDDIVNANMVDYPDDVRPYGWIVIPTSYQSCDFAMLNGWYRARVLNPGHLDASGVYTVAYGETLSEIGHRFGYLPSMIAAENGLEAPYLIYPYQELQMLRLPSLYDIGKAVLYVGGVGVSFTLMVLYRMRRRISAKKKQKPAA